MKSNKTNLILLYIGQ